VHARGELIDAGLLEVVDLFRQLFDILTAQIYQELDLNVTYLDVALGVGKLCGLKDAERAKSDTSHNRLFGSIMDEIKLREERHEEGIWTPRVPENEAFLPPPSNITLTDFDASYGDGEGAAAASLNPKGEKMRMQRRAALARVKSTERMLSARTPRVKE